MRRSTGHRLEGRLRKVGQVQHHVPAADIGGNTYDDLDNRRRIATSSRAHRSTQIQTRHTGDAIAC